MIDIIFATKNNGKLNEIKTLFENTNFNIISLEDADINIDIVENGKTFEENATIKAKLITNLTGKIVLADDSGLEIDFLDKKPGIHSARFLGKDTPYTIKNEKILEMMSLIPDKERTARFICVIVASFPNGKTLISKGVMEGVIHKEPVGENGFGFDPIFYIPELNMTNAQLSMSEKNKISHRGKALEIMKKKLLEEF